MVDMSWLWWSVTFPSRVTGSIQVYMDQNKKKQQNMALSFLLNVQGGLESEMHKKAEYDVLHSFWHFRLLLPALSISATRNLFFTKMSTIGEGFPR